MYPFRRCIDGALALNGRLVLRQGGSRPGRSYTSSKPASVIEFGTILTRARKSSNALRLTLVVFRKAPKTFRCPHSSSRRARCSAISVGDSSARTRFSSISQSLERKVAALDWRVGRPLQKTRETHTLTHTRHSPRDRSMTWVTSTDSMARIWLKIHSYNNETKMYFRLIVPPSEKPLRRDNSNANPASGFQVVRCPGAGRALCGAQWHESSVSAGPPLSGRGN